MIGPVDHTRRRRRIRQLAFGVRDSRRRLYRRADALGQSVHARISSKESLIAGFVAGLTVGVAAPAWRTAPARDGRHAGGRPSALGDGVRLLLRIGFRYLLDMLAEPRAASTAPAARNGDAH